MDADRFDNVARSLIAGSSRRTALGLVIGGIAASMGLAEGEARNRRKKKCKQCGPCRACKRGKCKSKPNGIGCGACKSCQGGQCVGGCQGGKNCQDGTCACPPGQKDCQNTCIPNSQCCGACPTGQTCCTNVGQCKDVRNDPAFCGQCANGQCPGGAICANGDCGQTCTVGQPCFTGCSCNTRVDPNHAGQNVCTGLGVFNCNTATVCTTDASCAPGTDGFRQVCVSGLCANKNVCADPCA